MRGHMRLVQGRRMHYRVDAGHDPCGKFIEILPGPHQAEVEILANAEQPQHWRHEVPVLSRDAHHRLDSGPARQGQYNRRQLDGLRSRPDNRQYLQRPEPLCERPARGGASCRDIQNSRTLFVS